MLDNKIIRIAKININIIKQINLLIVLCYIILSPSFAQSQQTQGTATLDVGYSAGPPGSTDNLLQISLENLDDIVSGLQFDICLGSLSGYLTLTSCETIDRATNLDCINSRVIYNPGSPNTDCGGNAERIILWVYSSDPADMIQEGTGPIINLKYDVSASAPYDFCDYLPAQGVGVVACDDEIVPGSCTNISFPPQDVFTEQGQFCFFDINCLGINPTEGFQGQSLTITITAENTHFTQDTDGPDVTFGDGTTGITVDSVIVVDDETLDVDITISPGAFPGTHDVTVTAETSFGTEVITCSSAFTVLETVETCLNVIPGSGTRAEQIEVTIIGQYTNFAQGVTEVEFSNPLVSVIGDPVVDTAQQVRVTIDIPFNTPLGSGNVMVTTGTEEVVCYNAFEVLDRIFVITNIRESNPTSASFTVSWITDAASDGEVHYSTDPTLSTYEIALDNRGNVHPDYTHHVSIGNLDTETTYYYEVKSGGTIDNNGGVYYSFTTMRIPSVPSPVCVVYGWVYQPDGINPAGDTITYLKVLHGTEESYWISTLTDSDGMWVLNLGNLYSTITDDALSYSVGDGITLEFQGGNSGIYGSTGEYTVPALCPLNIGSIILLRFLSLEMEFYAGFNLISLPFDPITDENFNEITPYTICTMMDAIPSSQAWSWDADTQQWFTALKVGGTCIGDQPFVDAPIKAGEGYFVKSDSNTTTTFYGQEIATPVALSFKTGFNLISIPFPQDFYTSCSLIESITGSSKSFSWDPSFQRWLSSLVITGGECIGDDFSVERDIGYIIHSDVDIATWVPGVGVVECQVDGDCDDGNVCTDDACVAGACQNTNNTDNCDDGLYCTESDACVGGACVGTARNCDDVFYCTGSESCDEGNDQCVSSGDPCTDDGTYCNGDESCDEGNDQCVSSGDPCTDDGTYCNGDESCDEVNDLCTTTGNPCSDDGTYCNGSESCDEGNDLCVSSGDPCPDNGLFCDGVEYCVEILDSCDSTGDPCVLPLTCDEANDVCDVSDVTLIIADAYGYSGTIDIDLDNNLDFVSAVHLDVCDRDQRAWLNIDTNSCSTTTRSSGFNCVISDLGGGCVGVDLTVVSSLIAPGIGTIAQLSYTLDVTAPPGEFADLNPEGIDVRDEFDNPLTFTPVPGSILVPIPPYFIPVATTSTWMDLWGSFMIDGIDAEVDDQVGVFVGNDCFGAYKVDTPGFYGFLSVYGDDPNTPQKDGADPGDLLTIKIWDSSVGVEDTLTTNDYTGPDPLIWTNSVVEQVDISADTRHFIPVATTSTWMDLWGSFMIEGVDAGVGDEVGVFVDSECFGAYKVDAVGWYGFLPVYGDDPNTPQKDGADPGDILTIKVWDNSAGIEYIVTIDDYTGPDPITWMDGDVVQVDIDVVDILARRDNNLPSTIRYICMAHFRDNSDNQNVTGLSDFTSASTKHRAQELVLLESSFEDSPYNAD